MGKYNHSLLLHRKSSAKVRRCLLHWDGEFNRTVFFKSADGTRSFSYGCGDCTFFVGPNRVGSSEDGLPGALVHLTNDGRQLEIRCRTSRCRAIIFRGGEAEMKTGSSLTIPADSHAVMLFN